MTYFLFETCKTKIDCSLNEHFKKPNDFEGCKKIYILLGTNGSYNQKHGDRF